MKKAILFQYAAVKNHVVVFVTILIIVILILLRAYAFHNLGQALAYIFAIWLCMFVTDLFILKWPVLKNDIIIRNPAKETLVWLVCAGLGLTILIINFSGRNNSDIHPLMRIMLALGKIFFGLPLALLLSMLLMKYKLPQIGFRFRKIFLAIIIITILAIVSYLVAPQNYQFQNVYHQMGIVGMFLNGLIFAGLSEEFSRYIAQSRLGAVLNNRGAGWLLASIIWAFFHLPKIYSEQHLLSESFHQALKYIPIGLMWGYMTYRTKTIIPATIVHGTNLWGFV